MEWKKSVDIGSHSGEATPWTRMSLMMMMMIMMTIVGVPGAWGRGGGGGVRTKFCISYIKC